MKMARLTIALLATLPLIAADQNPWKRWERQTHRQCPASHLEWLSDGSYDGLVADYVRTLPPPAQQNVRSDADFEHRCSGVTIGFQCEMAVHLDAFNKLGLLRSFAAYACRQYKCTEPVLCTGGAK